MLEYPLAWKGPGLAVGCLPEAEINALRCGHDGCDEGWGAAGGLKNIAASFGPPQWRCAKHAKPIDPSPHRQDLRDATDRYAREQARKAVDLERMRITALLSSTQDYRCVYAIRIIEEEHAARVAAEAAKRQPPAPPPVKEGV